MLTTLLLMAASPIVLSEFVYEKAPFPSCHASTIVETKDGLVSAWFGGDREGAPNVAIYLSRREEKGWSRPARAATGNGLPCWNPVLFQPQKGPLLLFYKVGPRPTNWWGMLTTSPDGGKTWTPSRRLPEGILGPVKNKPLELADGALLCPSSEEAGGWRVHFERTNDLGETWTRTLAVKDQQIAAIQPSILPMGERRLRAIGRTRQGKLFAVDSIDEGLSWSGMHLLDVPNPNSGTDALRLRDGRYLLAYNDTSKGRSPLNLALSKDGEQWTRVLDLETKPGEYSYPAVIQSEDGLVHITYTWHRKKIRHVVVDPQKLRN